MNQFQRENQHKYVTRRGQKSNRSLVILNDHRRQLIREIYDEVQSYRSSLASLPLSAATTNDNQTPSTCMVDKVVQVNLDDDQTVMR